MALVIDWVIIDCEDVEKTSAFWSAALELEQIWTGPRGGPSWLTLKEVSSVSCVLCRMRSGRPLAGALIGEKSQRRVLHPTFEDEGRPESSLPTRPTRSGSTSRASSTRPHYGWREVITTDSDERRYEARLSSPELAAWLLGGSLSSP